MPKVQPVQFDKFNQMLTVGDYVVFPIATKKLDVGMIIRQTPKMIRINPVGHERNQWGYGEYMKYPDDCIKMEGPSLTMYVLAKSS